MLKGLFKKLLLLFVVLAVLGAGAAYYAVNQIQQNLPQIITLQDYKPLLTTQVYDRSGKKIGEFFRERRILTPYDQMPKNLVNAFIAAEDDQFFQHKGVNYLAIMRAAIANFQAGRKVQGGSTITQQLAKTLLLQTNERTYMRKLREVFLAHKMEENLSKEDIIFLYLNQIYFGAGAHGVGVAAQTYFRKDIKDLKLSEMAILAGLPKAPSDYSPIRNPQRAKERQLYVLKRMAEVGFVNPEEADAAGKEPVTVYLKEKWEEQAPYFLEAVRTLLIPKIGEDKILNEGLSITTSLDLPKQIAAQESTKAGLRALDKRQGFRGAGENITEPQAVGDFLLKTRNEMIQKARPERIIQPDGTFLDYGPLNLAYDIKKGLPGYMILEETYKGIVSKVDDKNGLVMVKLAEVDGLIDFSSMQWARKPDTEKRYDLDLLKKPSDALKIGDVILVKLKSVKYDEEKAKAKKPAEGTTLPDFSKYVSLELEQEPLVDAGLISIEPATGDIIAMVGGYDFEKDKYNKAIQAARQTGSSFKTLVYTAALDKGYTPATPILDAPLIYESGTEDSEGQDSGKAAAKKGSEETKVWKPANHGRDFSGDIIFRNALVKSLNIPTVKIIEDIGVPWSADYAKRLGVYSTLNMDFTLALGSSSVTLYEMTKAFAQIAKLGKRVRPVIIHKVDDYAGQNLLGEVTLDERFKDQIEPIEKMFEERRKKFYEQKLAGKEIDPKKEIDANFFFDDPEQLISPKTAYLMTTLLKAVVEDRDGTGGRARVLERDVAGKTGSTNGYFDAWFVGFTQQITTGVWVGYSQEKSIGKGEVGGRAALPIWVDYMKAAHDKLPAMTLAVPEGIVFANIDADSGLLATTSSRNVIRQAFKEGTEPSSAKASSEEESDFYKQDLTE
ncbi:MAG: PBP1A family penicillin-binding protein [Bdellovibrionaceae bacterium]|nr:PBP1A family penicillin-binding protein [Pseudobdellovibrionaceae bacterium]